MVSHENEVAIEGLVFLASLVALKSSDIDVILGMDWLSRQTVVLDCKAKSVKLTHTSGQTIDYTSPSSRTQLHSLNVLIPTTGICWFAGKGHFKRQQRLCR